MNPVLPVAAAALRCWQFRFVTQAEPGERVFKEFAHPARRCAVMDALSPEASVSREDTPRTVDALRVLCLPEAAAVPGQWQQSAERWMTLPSLVGDAPAIDVSAPGTRVLWQPGRAILQGAAEHSDAALSALVDFAFYEGELRQLEREIDAEWPLVEADIALTHRVRAADLARWAHVNDMTHRVTLRRMRYARLEGPLAAAPLTLPRGARQLVSELLARADVERRLELVDDRLAVYEDVYELANDRLSEYRYFRVECVVEIVVAFLLLAEVVIMLWEVYLTYGSGGS